MEKGFRRNLQYEDGRWGPDQKPDTIDRDEETRDLSNAPMPLEPVLPLPSGTSSVKLPLLISSSVGGETRKSFSDLQIRHETSASSSLLIKPEHR